MKKAELESRVAQLEKKEFFCRQNHGQKQTSTIRPGIKYPDPVCSEFDAFIRLIQISDDPGFGYAGHVLDNRYNDGGHADKAVQIPMSNEMRDRFVYFFAKVRQAVKAMEKESYNAGVEYGRNLLGQLAKGELSISDFDAISEGEIPRRRSF